jgi:phosphoribosyl-AMP cyclohydrolase / phosphoribosyl-ATP pyrophosphohydrolase
MNLAIEDLKFDERGLIPAIVQDVESQRVLTLAYMNAESLALTLQTGETWFWSRARARLWHKGATSGHTQRVRHIVVDCDHDALTVLVSANGPACHTGEQSCFHNALAAAAKFRGNARETSSTLGQVLGDLYEVVETRKRDRPEGSYTAYLFNEGVDKILKKIGEESSETIIAAKNDDREALAGEVSDLLYHLVVLLVECDLSLDDVRDELLGRR